jgi:aryl-alcohol dehydrogenase-like predicted oxidoreductase
LQIYISQQFYIPSLAVPVVVPTIPSILLQHTAAPNTSIPQLGFGTYRLRKDDVITPLSLALGAGYRMLDTAQVYDNEKQIGASIASLPFVNDLFITTKLWRSNQGEMRAKQEVSEEPSDIFYRKQRDCPEEFTKVFT